MSNNLPLTATAALALLKESEDRFKERMERIKFMSNPHRGGHDWGEIHTGFDKTICQFTKHYGEFWTHVLVDDRPYMEWLVSGEHDMELTEELYDHLMELLENG